MWDLPGPGLEPVSPALAGRFLTTEPPGKSWARDFHFKIIRGIDSLSVLVTEAVIFMLVAEAGSPGQLGCLHHGPPWAAAKHHLPGTPSWECWTPALCPQQGALGMAMSREHGVWKPC